MGASTKIIQGELIDLYGASGYKSIMQTMTKVSGKTEKEIIKNFELFSDLSEGVFGKSSESKILRFGMLNCKHKEVV